MYTYPRPFWLKNLIPATKAKTARFWTEGPIGKCFTKKDAETPWMYTYPAVIWVISLIPAARAKTARFWTEGPIGKCFTKKDAENP